MISFKGAQFPKEVILFAVFFYVRYTVSYRDLRSGLIDHIQKMTMAAMAMADMKVCAHRS